MFSVPCLHVSPANTRRIVLLLRIDFRCCHTQNDPGRSGWWCRLYLIHMVKRVDLCRIHTAPDCSKIFRRSSRRIVQPPGVDDLLRLSPDFLQRDFRHFQLLNVRKLLDSILTHLLKFKQMSKMSTLGSTAFLFPVHDLLSPFITIFGICRQDDYSPHVHAHIVSVPIWPACHRPLDVRCRTGLQSPPPVPLISSLVVSLNFPQL